MKTKVDLSLLNILNLLRVVELFQVGVPNDIFYFYAFGWVEL